MEAPQLGREGTTFERRWDHDDGVQHHNSPYTLEDGSAEGTSLSDDICENSSNISSKSRFTQALKKLQQDGVVEAAAEVLRSKPYGKKCLLLLIHSLIGCGVLFGLSVVLTLQAPLRFAALAAADSVVMLTLRSVPAGLLLSLTLWLLRQAYAAYYRENVYSHRHYEDNDLSSRHPRHQHRRAATYIFCLCASEIWVLLLLWMAGRYTPAAGLIAVPAAAAIRCLLKNILIDWCSSETADKTLDINHSINPTNMAYAAEQPINNTNTTNTNSYKGMIRVYLQEALKAPNFFGLPDVGRAEIPYTPLPTTPEVSAEAGDPNNSNTSSIVEVALGLLQPSEGEMQPFLQVGLMYLAMWVDGVLFFSLCGLLLLPLLQLRAGFFLIGGSPFHAAACCCLAAAAAATDRAFRGGYNRKNDEWEIEGALNQRLLGAPVGGGPSSTTPIRGLTIHDNSTTHRSLFQHPEEGGPLNYGGGGPLNYEGGQPLNYDGTSLNYAGGPLNYAQQQGSLNYAGGPPPVDCYGAHIHTDPRGGPHTNELQQQHHSTNPEAFQETFKAAAAAAAATAAAQQEIERQQQPRQETIPDNDNHSIYDSPAHPQQQENNLDTEEEEEQEKEEEEETGRDAEDSERHTEEIEGSKGPGSPVSIN